MKTPKHSLRKIVDFLNNPDEDGGFWLPNIQRRFVWTEDQICRLFDSILREYPISTLLVWKTKSTIRRRKFIDNYRTGMDIQTYYVPDDDKKKCLVLDGQQRLQSLFIGLKGSYEGRELYLDVLSGEVAAPDDVKYKFEFLEPAMAHFPWVKFKDLVFSTADPLTAAENLIAGAGRELTPEEKRKVSKHVGIVFKTFHSDDGVSYQELDSTENTELYAEDDVVEVFIRANSGGTRLGKSDLLFALLTSTWEDADARVDDLIGRLNQHGFAFNRDFVLKTCLSILGKGARYEVSKFRKDDVREEIVTKWDTIAQAIEDVLDFVKGKTYIKCDKALPSNLALIPLVYARFNFPEAWRAVRDVDSYLLRVLISGAYGGTPDQLIDDTVTKIAERKAFDMADAFEAVRSKGRSLEITEEKLWEIGYGSDAVHLLFNIWYKEFNYTPAYQNNYPQVDHVFPQSALRDVKVVNPDTGRRVMKYREATRDQLANCMLLTQEENGAGGKWDTLPETWFADKPPEYLAMHLIPTDKALWKMDKFEDFIAERKKLIKDKFSFLLAKQGA